MTIMEEMTAAKLHLLALQSISEIHTGGKLAVIVGGSGLYVKALTHGLSPAVESDPKTRAKLSKLSLDQMRMRLAELDPESARKIDLKNRRRVMRVLEICLLTGKSASAQRTGWNAVEAAVLSGKWGGAAETAATKRGIVLREREELYERLKRRVA